MKNVVVNYKGVDVIVSDSGDVYSCDRYTQWKNGLKKCASKKLIKKLDKDGYYFVRLNKDKKRYHVKVHRLVALAFIPNPNNLPCINHKNEIKTDNNVSNLEWCNVFYNNHYNNRYSKIKNFRKPVFQYTIEGDFVCKFESIRAAAKSIGCSKGYIGNCCNGRVKSALGYVWKFY